MFRRCRLHNHCCNLYADSAPATCRVSERDCPHPLLFTVHTAFYDTSADTVTALNRIPTTSPESKPLMLMSSVAGRSNRSEFHDPTIILYTGTLHFLLLDCTLTDAFTLHQIVPIFVPAGPQASTFGVLPSACLSRSIIASFCSRKLWT